VVSGLDVADYERSGPEKSWTLPSLRDTTRVTHGVATLLWRKTPEFTLKKNQKIIKTPRHTKCLKKVKTKLETHATGTCT